MSPNSVALILGTNENSGGGFSYENALKKYLSQLSKDESFSLRIFYSGGGHNLVELEGDVVPANAIPDHRLISMFRRLIGICCGERNKQSPEEFLISEGFDLVYFASPNKLITNFGLLPFVCTVWDLGHRDLPEFPEFRGKTWDTREQLYGKALPRAFHVFSESEATRERLIDIYGLRKDKVSAIGLLYEPPQSIASVDNLSLVCPEPYFIYPAKKWAHKNHVVILDALTEVLKVHPNVKLVLTGVVDERLTHFVREKICSLGLEESVLDLGFVDARHLDTLIERASALLMPSFLGPTNIPPLQALALGTPAIVSDAHIFEDRIQAELTVVEATDRHAWSEKMIEVLDDPARKIPVAPDISKSLAEIKKVLLGFFLRSQTWGIHE